jgi:hypothetical protein
MNRSTLEILARLQKRKRELDESITNAMNFDSEGPTKVRKLARFEGERAGIEAAISIVEALEVRAT